MALSRNEFAEAAGVSRQAVAKALKRRRLVADADRIDPSDPTNDLYLARRNKEIDCDGRDIRSHRGPGQSCLATASQEEEPYAVGKFLAPYGDRMVDPRAADYAVSGLAGANEEAIRAIAVFPEELGELRNEIAYLRNCKRGA